MQTVGVITNYIDLAQIMLYMFWLFFAGLIYYLVRENHREGYPMESGSSGRAVVKGWPIPEPKTFKLEGGKSVTVPDLHRGEPPLGGRPSSPTSGAPLEPLGNGMDDAVGPGRLCNARRRARNEHTRHTGHSATAHCRWF